MAEAIDAVSAPVERPEWPCKKKMPPPQKKCHFISEMSVERRFGIQVTASLPYDRVHEGMSRAVTNRTQIIPGGAGDCSELVAGARLRLHRVLVDIDGIHPLEDKLLAPKTRRDRASAVQRPNVCHNAVLGRAHGMADLL